MREQIKRALARVPDPGPAAGASLLIYHRVGGGSGDELDLPFDAFRQQLDVLGEHDVLPLDAALDRLERRDPRPSVVLTFDDGFADMYEHAWPELRRRGMPFVLYLASAYMGEPMRWEGGTARDGTARGMTWSQVYEMVDTGLCTPGNHTHDHVPPAQLDTEQLDRCGDEVEKRTGVRPRHFAYPWGVPVPDVEPALQERFRSAATGTLGRNAPGADPLRLRRIPVRRTDPVRFFHAKLTGGLRAERCYGAVVATAKRVGMHA